MTKAIRGLVYTLALVGDELKRNLLMKTIAKRFNLREKLIESELNTFLQQQKEKGFVSTVRPEQRSADQQTQSQLALSSKSADENPYEKELIRLLYSGEEEIISHILDKISVENYNDHSMRKLAEIVRDGFNEQKFSPAYLIDKIEGEDLQEFILELTLADESISKKWDEFSYNGKIEKDTLDHALETIKNFLLYQIDQQIKLNNQFITDSKDERLHLEMMKRNQELQDEKKSLLGSKNKQI